MKITITQQHIDNGVRNRSWACPAYLALQDAGIPVKAVQFWGIVDGFQAACKDGYQVALGREMTEYILRFDRGERVEPYTFEFPDTQVEAGVEAVLVEA